MSDVYLIYTRGKDGLRWTECGQLFPSQEAAMKAAHRIMSDTPNYMDYDLGAIRVARAFRAGPGHYKDIEVVFYREF